MHDTTMHDTTMHDTTTASMPTPSMHDPMVATERPELRSLRRVGVDRQSRRSLLVGGALVIMILGGAGAVAWAAAPVDPKPAVSVDAENSSGADGNSTGPTGGESSLTDASPSAGPAAGPSAAAGNPGDPGADPGVGTTEPPVGDLPATPGQGPATVSPLGPGDSGFGWPATAFGLITIGPRS